MKSAVLFLLLCIYMLAAKAQQSPAEFLGYQPGARFTPHYKVVDYFRKIAEGNAMMRFETYGQTYEGRPLVLAILSGRSLPVARSRRRISKYSEPFVSRA